MVMASGNLRGPDGAPASPSIAIALGLLFLAAGLTVLLGIPWAVSKSRRDTQRRAQNASSPWLWRADWADSRCNSQTKSQLITAWTAAILCNAFGSMCVVL